MEQEEKKWCVYCHTNKINGKKYIGITSVSPNKRWGSNGINYKTQNFYKAINKYGWNGFEHTILHKELSEKESKIKEKYYIKIYNTKFPNGYNLTDGGDGAVGLTVSEETRKKIRESRFGKYKGEDNNFYGKHHSEESRQKIKDNLIVRYGKDNPRSIGVYQFDINTLRIVNKFDCISDAEKYIGHKGGVQDCVEREQVTSGGYYWQRVCDTIDGKYVGKLKSNISYYLKKIEQIDIETDNVINSFTSIPNANEYLGLNRRSSGIYIALDKKNKTAYGYRWRIKI